MKKRDKEMKKMAKCVATKSTNRSERSFRRSWKTLESIKGALNQDIQARRNVPYKTNS
jgi:hypothetical protein